MSTLTVAKGTAAAWSVPEVFGYEDESNQAFVLDGTAATPNPEGVRQAAEGCPELKISQLSSLPAT